MISRRFGGEWERWVEKWWGKEERERKKRYKVGWIVVGLLICGRTGDLRKLLVARCGEHELRLKRLCIATMNRSREGAKTVC